MSAQHTPGPWEAPRNGLDGAVYAPNAPKGSLWRITDRVHGLTHDELAANAQLIAAAPELLVALNMLNDSGSLVCMFDHLNPCWDDRPSDAPGRHWGEGDACACCIARAAIAKAEGRS